MLYYSHLDTASIKTLSFLKNSLALIADNKMPIEGTIQYKRMELGKNCGYEKILCGIIQLCLIITNTINDADNVLI